MGDDCRDLLPGWEVTGCAGACSMVACSNGLEPPTALGSTYEDALQVHSTNHKCLSSNIMEETAIFFLLIGCSSCATSKRPCAWHDQPPPLVAPSLHAPACRWPVQRVDLQWVVSWALGPPQGAYVICGPRLGPPPLPPPCHQGLKAATDASVLGHPKLSLCWTRALGLTLSMLLLLRTALQSLVSCR